MNLDSLNFAEQQLISEVNNCVGTMEEKHAQLQNNGVFEKYKQIFESYVQLVNLENERLEALKRATFIYWYDCIEPSCFSGICGINDPWSDSNEKLLDTLESEVRNGKLDEELSWMLAYYINFFPHIFSLEQLPYLSRFQKEADSEQWLNVELRARNFENRGQMGEYWLSLAQNTKQFDENAT